MSNPAWCQSNSLIACCKGCTKRYPGCHDRCEKYQTAKAENLKRKKEYYGDSFMHKYIGERVMKSRDVAARRQRKRNGNKNPGRGG